METPKKTTRPSFEQVVNAFNDHKVISSSITLKDLAAVSSKLASSLGDDELWNHSV